MDLQVLAPVAFVLSIPIFIVLALFIDALSRIEFKFAWKKYAFVWFTAFVAAFSVLPFTIDGDYMYLLAFESPEISVALVLLFAFAVYLIIFNKTKR